MIRNNKLQKYVMAAIALFGVIEIAVIRFAFPSYYSNLLLLIPAWFLLMGFIVLLILTRTDIHPRRAVARLMLFSVAQMFVSFAMLFVCYYLIENNRKTLVLAFAVFYIFFLGVRFYILHIVDRQNRKT